MKKRIIAAILCVTFALFGTLGCEKKPDEEKALGDAAKKVEATADKAADAAEEAVE